MIKVAALTQGLSKPSARFRIRQHIPTLYTHRIIVNDYIAPRQMTVPLLAGSGKLALAGQLALTVTRNLPRVVKSYGADAVWINREIITSFCTFEPFLRTPRFFDVDDAIWINRPAVKKIARAATAVIAGNSFLANWFLTYCANVHIVHTAIDTKKFVPEHSQKEKEHFVIGWTGSKDNLSYVYDIESALGKFLSDHPDARLQILCDTAPHFREIPNARVDFVKWTPNNEVEVVQNFDVGIMPLRDGDWERGKCSYKMLQYMATGLPVIASPVGLNADILSMGDIGFGANTLDDWYDALKILRNDDAIKSQQGICGRNIAESRFSVEVISQQIANIMTNTLAPGPNGIGQS